MAVYEDGSRDCPRCLALQRSSPARVRGDSLACCTSCELVLRDEFAADMAAVTAFLVPWALFADWLETQGRL